jgi:hypothetical protein
MLTVMATRAERFRAASERSHGKRPKAQQDTSRPRVKAGEDIAAAQGARSSGASVSHGRKAAYAYEDTKAPTPPSRKSSRRSGNRQKAAIGLKAKQMLSVIGPQRRRGSEKR